MVELWVLVPVTFFASIAAVIIAGLYFWNERKKYDGGGEYRRLAEEAVRGQQALLAEVEAMNGTMKEIARLLKEV